jgi:hypothetical protein
MKTNGLIWKDRDWLHEQYVVKRRSTRDIAEEVGRGVSTIRNWLCRHDIPRRAPGGKSAAMAHYSKDLPPIATVLRAACQAADIHPAILDCPRSHDCGMTFEELADKRALVFGATRELTEASLPQIQRVAGVRNHSLIATAHTRFRLKHPSEQLAFMRRLMEIAESFQPQHKEGGVEADSNGGQGPAHPQPDMQGRVVVDIR